MDHIKEESLIDHVKESATDESRKRSHLQIVVRVNGRATDGPRNGGTDEPHKDKTDVGQCEKKHY